MKLLISEGKFPAAKAVSFSSIGLTVESGTVTATETTPAAPKDKVMIKITMDFDSRKFRRDLEKQVQEAARKQVHSKLRDLERRGLRTSFGPSNSSSLNIQFHGPEELIAEAKRRFS